jgi:hypothetical protein
LPHYGRAAFARREKFSEMAMKRSGLAILFCLLLSGCIFDPVFDTSSWSAYQTSLATIQAKMSNDDLRRLEVALKYLESDGAPRIAVQPVNVMVVSTGYTSAGAFLGRLAPSINGRSGRAVIQNLAMKLDAEISSIESRMRNIDKALAAVEVTGASYRWRRSGNLEQPVIEFSVYNAGKVPISRVYLTGVLTTPNRTIPWVKQAWVRSFRGGLEPRERQRVTLEPRFGEWNDRQLKDLYNADLKVTVTNFEDVNGEKHLGLDIDSLDVKRKVRTSLQ